MRNVSRVWAFETGLAAGVELGSEIPVNEYYEYFGPDYKLDVRASNMDDLNTPQYLNRIKTIVMENLRSLGGPPSVQMQDIPTLPLDAAMDDPNQDEDTISPDKRRPMRLLDALVQPEGELSDSEDEGEGGRRDHKRHRDPESVTGGLGRRFGVGVGIMGAGSTVTAGSGSGGPSVHTTVDVIARKKAEFEALAAAAAAAESKPSDDMDVDEPTSATNLNVSGTAVESGSSLLSDLGSKASVEEGEITSSGGDAVKESKMTPAGGSGPQAPLTPPSDSAAPR